MEGSDDQRFVSAIDERLLVGLAVVRSLLETQSATQTAHTLGIAPATALRRLAGAEEALGVRLFDRHPRGLATLPAAQRLKPWLEQVASALDGLVREAAGLEARAAGRVTLALPAGIVSLLLPALPAFRLQYPDLELELVVSNSMADLERREADLALRVAPPETGDLVRQLVTPFRLAVACHRNLLQDCADWRALPWVSWDSRHAHLPEAQWVADHVPANQIVLRCSDVVSQLEAAGQGIGAIVTAHPLVEHVPTLTVISTGIDMPQGALWLATHAGLRPVPRVDAVWRWLLETLRG